MTSTNLPTCPVYVHVGYPKCASTSLQQNLFKSHAEINYLGLADEPQGTESSDRNRALSQFYKRLIQASEIEWRSQSSANILKPISPYFLEQKINLLSNEDLLNPCYSDNVLKAYRLQQILPNAKIILVIRNQVDVLVSWYNMLIPPFEVKGFNIQKNNLDDWIQENFCEPYIFNGFLPSLKYFEFVELYKKVFGENNVGVFLFEDIIHQPDSFIKEFSSFTKTDIEEGRALIAQQPHNQAKDLQYIRFRRGVLSNLRLSTFLPGSVRRFLIERVMKPFLLNAVSRKEQISDRTLSRVAEYYRTSNEKLLHQYCSNLRDYGYIGLS